MKVRTHETIFQRRAKEIFECGGQDRYVILENNGIAAGHFEARRA